MGVALAVRRRWVGDGQRLPWGSHGPTFLVLELQRIHIHSRTAQGIATRAQEKSGAEQAAQANQVLERGPAIGRDGDRAFHALVPPARGEQVVPSDEHQAMEGLVS